MKLTDFLTFDQVSVRDDARSRRDAIETLARMMADASGVPADAFSDTLGAREKLGSTAIGRGVAIPHAKHADLDRPVVAVLILATPLDFEAPDDEPVDIVVGIVTPPEEKEIAMLATFVKKLRDPKYLNALRAAKTPEEAIAVLKREPAEPAA